MKFVMGSDIDSALCAILKHEFLRCEDAFKEFTEFGQLMIMMAQAEAVSRKPPTPHEGRWVAFKTYNAYARFIHHLYEFMMGAFVREKGNTATISAEEAERLIQSNANRVLTGRRQAILNGTAPSWENSIRAYPEQVPAEFAANFRAMRNKSSGHVTYERSVVSLTEFYDKYHMFLHMQYLNCRGFWGSHRDEEFPDLKEVTGFTVLILKGKLI